MNTKNPSLRTLTATTPDTPRSLRDKEAIKNRCKLLGEPHIAPLTAYVEKLRTAYPDWEVPEFDPLDGGVDADILFLFEKPGPKTSRKGGSGFISRDNDDPTAEAIFKFMNEACIPRKRVVQWNVIPGWNETIKITTSEWRTGMDELRDLLSLLPKLKTAVLVGRRAAKVQKLLEDMNIRVVTSAHPSPKVRSIHPEKWNEIPKQWASASKDSI